MININAEYLEIERAIIGIALVKFEEAHIFRALLTADDFDDPECATAFGIFLEAKDAQELLDGMYAKKLGYMAAGCMDNGYINAPAYWSHIARKLLTRNNNRRLVHRIQDVMRGADNEEMLSRLEKLVEEAQEKVKDAMPDDSPARLAEAAIANMLDDDRGRRIYTGIAPLDALTAGLRKGNVSVLGAEPSTGKTTLALNIAHHAIRNNKRVCYFSLEMSGIQLLDRMVANDADISYSSISSKSLSERELKWYKHTVKALTEGGLLYFFDTEYLLEDMVSHILRIKPDLVIVDFLQFCRTATNTTNTADRLEYIVSEFKRVAKLPYCSCHIMLLSQPSRQSSAERQSMFALKGSSAIEQGGDVIFLLDRPAVRDPKFPLEQANVRVGKNKFGKVGSVDLFFDGNRQQFREIRAEDLFQRETESEDRPAW